MELIHHTLNWVKGEILAKGKKTDIGIAGYRIVDAQVEPYLDW